LPHILALGDRFQMQQVIVQCETHLISPTTFSMAEKLQMSDRYRLEKLKDHCLLSCSTALEIGTLESTPEYANFSADMKAAICDRVLKLVTMEAKGGVADNSGDGNAVYINLKVAGYNSDMDVVKFRLKYETSMGKLKRSYAERIGVPVTSIRFLFDGRRINNDDTAMSLEMEDDDVIEVYREQPGGAEDFHHDFLF
ncbi:hypothetical protein PMAYCL1PPCAC_25568, partial [Pristionchus mayeri]